MEQLINGQYNYGRYFIKNCKLTHVFNFYHADTAVDKVKIKLDNVNSKVIGIQLNGNETFLII